MKWDGTARKPGEPDVGSMLWFGFWLLSTLVGGVLGLVYIPWDGGFIAFLFLYLFVLAILIGEFVSAYKGEDTYSY